MTPPPDSTELRVTSEPVPAVVGTATQGSPVFQRVDSRAGEQCGSFGDIDRTTAAESQYGIAARVGQQRHGSAHPLDGWFGRDSERDA